MGEHAVPVCFSYSTDGRNEERRRQLQANIDVNNMQFKIFFMQMFHEEGNTLNDFIKPEGYTQCVLVETQKKASTLFIRKLHRAPLPNLYALCIDIDKFFWFNQHI